MADKRGATPRLDPKDREPVTQGDLEDVFSRLASVPPNSTGSQNREPTREELERRYRLVRRKASRHPVNRFADFGA